MSGGGIDFSNLSLSELFAQEAEQQAQVLSDGLLVLERAPEDPATLEVCMRAAHSLKGAARIVGVEVGVTLAHAMEEAFVGAQRGEATLSAGDIDTLFACVDELRALALPGRAPATERVAALIGALDPRLAHSPAPTPVQAGAAAPASRRQDDADGADSAVRPRFAAPPDHAAQAFADLDAQPGAAPLPPGDSAVSTARHAEAHPAATVAQPGDDRRDRDAAMRAAELSGHGVTHEGGKASIEVANGGGAADAAASGTANGSAATEPGGGQPDARKEHAGERTLRVGAARLDRLLALSGQTLVETRRLAPLGLDLSVLHRRQHDLRRSLTALRQALSSDTDSAAARDAIVPAGLAPGDVVSGLLATLNEQIDANAAAIARFQSAFDAFERSQFAQAERLYEQTLAMRMRPFGDLTPAYPRAMRDLSRTLGKPVRFDIEGTATPVDRDILARLDAPLGHLLRNALDHGIETVDERVAQGKPATGHIVLGAAHRAGALEISVSDDGRGIDIEAVRRRVVARGLAERAVAARLSESELLEFLFLPGFTLRDTVTDVSGRGVGLDAVQAMVRDVHGVLRVVQSRGAGSRFVLVLPLTRSVMRCLIAEVDGAPFAFPLARVQAALRVAREAVQRVEGREHFERNGRSIALVSARQLLAGTGPALASPPNGPDHEAMPVLIVGEDDLYGMAVDGFVGERPVVVHALDERLGKVEDVAAAGLLDDGSPVLIVDVDDLLNSLAKFAASRRFDEIARPPATGSVRRAKRVLVVDDSLTVRELERTLLTARGYEVVVAVDGVDALNALHAAAFDLVITDVDMPRMDGIELVRTLRREADLARLPVMIVSYKDREEDRQRGLEAGADYYLAKGSFHDAGLLDAVNDLIGEAFE